MTVATAAPAAAAPVGDTGIINVPQVPGGGHEVVTPPLPRAPLPTAPLPPDPPAVVGRVQTPASNPPSISGSGNGKIVYDRPYGSPRGIFSANPDGTGIALVITTPTGAVDSAPAVARDGRIAFSRRTGTTAAIYVANGDGSGLRQLTTPTTTANEHQYPAWSPDSTQIVYTNRLPNRADLFTVNVQSALSQVLAFAPASAYDNDADWSPDGKTIVFSREFGSAWGGDQTRRQADLYTIDVATKRATALTGLCCRGGAALAPSWSPDGLNVAYASAVAGLPCQANVDCAHVVVMSVRGRTPISVTTGTFRDSQPAWSPDASRIAMVRAGGGGLSGAVVHVRATDGGDVRYVDGREGSQRVSWGVGAPSPVTPYINELVRITRPLGATAGPITGSGVINTIRAIANLPPVEPPAPVPMLGEAPRLPLVETVVNLALPVILPGIQMRYEVTVPGDTRVTRTYAALPLVPHPISLDNDAVPDATALLVPVLPDAVRLTITRSPLALLQAPKGAKIEAVIADTLANGGETKNELRLGFDQRTTWVPPVIETTIRVPASNIYTANVTMTQELIGPLLKSYTITGGIRSLGPVERALAFTAQVGYPPSDSHDFPPPAPLTTDVAIDLNPRARVEVAVPTSTKIEVNATDGPKPLRTLQANLYGIPAKATAPADSVLPATSIAVKYKANEQQLVYDAPAPLGSFNITYDESEPGATRNAAVTAVSVPKHVEIGVAQRDPAKPGLVGTYRAAGPLGSLDVLFADSTGLAGRAKAVQLAARTLPPSIDLDIGDPVAEKLDGLGGVFGSLDVKLADDAADFRRPDINLSNDGVKVIDTPDDFVIHAHVEGLKRLDLHREGGAARCGSGYEMCATAVLDKARVFQVDLTNARRQYIRATLRDLQPGATTVKLGSSPLKLWYDAQTPTTRLDVDTNVAGAGQTRRNLHVDLAPLPVKFNACVAGRLHCGRTFQTTFGSDVGAILFDASQRVTLNVFDDQDDNNQIRVKATASHAEFAAQAESGDTFITCFGGPGQIFVDTNDTLAEVDASLRVHDSVCDSERNLRVFLPAGFKAQDRYISFAHPLVETPTTYSGTIVCPSGIDVRLIDALPFDGDVEVDDWLCAGPST